MEFWIISFSIVAVVTLLLIIALKKQPLADYQTNVNKNFCKQQILALEKDANDGIISQEEFQSLYTDLAKKLLAIDKENQIPFSKNQKKLLPTLIVIIPVVIFGLSFTLYWVLGSVGYPDLPRSVRIEQAKQRLISRPSFEEYQQQFQVVENQPEEKNHVELVNQLRQTLEKRPNDLEGHILLARIETGLENYLAASKAQKRVLELKEGSSDEEDYFYLAELLILATNGYISPEAESALEKVLEINPQNQPALFYIGLMMAQNGRPDYTFKIWNKLLKTSPKGSPWLETIYAQMEGIAEMAGIKNYNLSNINQFPDKTKKKKLSTNDIKAIKDLSSLEVMELAKNMVKRLTNRLETQGGTAEEWSKLINSLIVLGEAEEAKIMFNKAEKRFSQDPNSLKTVRKTAKENGLLK